MLGTIIAATLASVTLNHTYPRAMEITEIDRKADVAVCVDATGLEWSFYGPEDLEVGDLVICTMFDKGTKNNILDDEIVDVIWSGYWIEGDKLMSPERRVK